MVSRSALFEGASQPLKIMSQHRRFAGSLSASVIALSVLVPSLASAAPKDAAAKRLANQAMQTDYLGTQFKKAEQKLKKAIQQCGADKCSADVEARLHLDLATVYIAGTKQVPKGKSELKLALAADPDVQLDKELVTPQLRKAFLAAGGHDGEAQKEKEKEKEKEKADEDCTPGSEGCDVEAPAPTPTEPEKKPAEEEPEASSPRKHNWLSVGIQQDFLVYSSQDDVCASDGPDPVFYAGAKQYSCFQGGQAYGQDGSHEPILAGVGNHVSGGVGMATTRILLGFDRLLGTNVTLGARLGFAFGGGPTPPSGDKFLPLHAELRGAYWFGSDPFASGSVRPFAALSFGLAEVDGHVPVEYYASVDGQANNAKGTLDAWRKTGKTFAGAGLGMMIPFGNSGIVPELRVMEMLGASATSLGLSLGYAYGF